MNSGDINLLFFLVLSILLVQAKGIDSCKDNCLECEFDKQQNNKCLKCADDYLVDEQSYLCKYQLCPLGLYLNNNQDKECVLICDNLFVGDQQTNTCKKIDKCNTFSQKNQNYNFDKPIQEATRITSTDIIIVQKGLLSTIQNTGAELKIVQFNDEIVEIKSFQNYIFMIGSDNSIYKWDVKQQQKDKVMDFLSSQTTTLLISLVENKILFLIILQPDEKLIQAISFFNLLKEEKETSINQTFNFSTYDKVQISNDLIFLTNSKSELEITKIALDQSFVLQHTQSIVCKTQIPFVNIAISLDFGNNNEYLLTTLNSIPDLNNYYINFDMNICILANMESYINKNQIVKSILLKENNAQFFAILTYTSILIIKSLTLEIFQQIQLDHYQLVDATVISINGQQNQIVVLVNNINNNNNNLLLFSKQNTQYELVNSIENIISDSNQLYQIQDYTQSIKTSGIIISSIKELQFIQFKQFDDYEYVNMKDFSLFKQIQPGKVNDIIIFENSSLLINCLQSGYIVIYDISSGLEGEMKNYISYAQESCLKIQKLNEQYILALFSKRIIQIDIFSGNVFSEKQFINQTQQISDISVNGKNTLQIYDNCLEIIDNNLKEQIFFNCQIITQENILSAKQNLSLNIITQSNYYVKIIQLLTQTQNYQVVKYINLINKINFFSSIHLEIQNSTENSYKIEEIILFDENSTFYIFDDQLNELHKMKLTQIKKPTQIKRTVNDSFMYFIIENILKIPQFQHNLVAIKKGYTQDVVWSFVGYEDSPIIDDPIKFISDNGITYYHVRQYLFLKVVLVLKYHVFNLESQQKNYVYGHGYIIGDQNTIQIRIQDKRDIRNISYVGTEQGRLQIQNSEFKRYSTFNIQQYFESNIETIIKIIQSPILGKFFIQTTMKILVFNIHTNLLEDSIPLLYDDSQPIIITLIENISALTFYNNQYLQIRVYTNFQQAQSYKYDQMQNLYGWEYDKIQDIIYVYGDGLVSLNNKLQIQQVILDKDKATCQMCVFTDDSIVCKINRKDLIFINKISNSQTYQITLPQYNPSSQYILKYDASFSNIYFIQDSIQVFSLIGLLKATISFKFQGLLNCILGDVYAIVFAISSVGIVMRQNLIIYTEFASPSGFLIMNYIFVSLYKTIIYSCNNALFTQFYAYDVVNKISTGRIQQYFPENGSGIVVQADQDINQTYLNYLDEQGNFINVLLEGSYTIMGNTKILEINENNDKPLGYSIDYSFGRILVYTKAVIYVLNYNMMPDKYLSRRTTNYKMFTSVDTSIKTINNDNIQINKKHLILGDNGYIFRFQDNQLLFDIHFIDQIQEIKYVLGLKILVIAFTNRIEFTWSYEYGNQQSFSKNKQIFQINKFNSFLDDDIFTTYDGRMIHFDYVNNRIIKEIQLPQLKSLTCFYIHSQKQHIILGFHDGFILVYQKILQKEFSFTEIQLQTTINFKKSIKYTIEISQNIVLISTIQGEIVKFNTETNKIIENLTIKNFYLNIINSEKKLLNNFLFDSFYNRLIFQYYGDNYGIVISLIDNSLQGYINSADHQNTNIILSEEYIVTFSSYQLNFFSRVNIQFIGSIMGNNLYEQITEVIIIQKYYVFILYTDKLKVNYFSGDQQHLLDIKYVSNSYPIQYFYDPSQQEIQFIGLSDQGVFTETIVVKSMFNNEVQQCSMIIDAENLSLISQQIAMIQEPKKEIQENGGKIMIQSDGSTVGLYVAIQSHFIHFFYNILTEAQIKSQVNTIFEDQNQSYDFQIMQDTFSAINLIKLNLKNANFIFDPLVSVFKFNNQTKIINFQNITIFDKGDIKGKGIYFVDLEAVIIQNLRISNNKIIEDVEEKEIMNLLYFENIKKVYIYQIQISNNMVSSSISQSTKELLYFKNIQEVIIQDILIENNTNLGNFFRFDTISSLRINNAAIQKNTQKNFQDSLIKVLFNLQSCQFSSLNSIMFKNNQNYQLIQSTNSQVQSTQIVIQTNDYLSIQNSQLLNNNNNLNFLINIQCSNLLFQNLEYSQNEGNISIQQSISIMIENSKFDSNFGHNGGSLYIVGLKSALSIKSTIITNNTANASGGGIYIEDIFSQMISISQDSIISNNKALIGGGLRIINVISQVPLPFGYPYQDIIKDNQGEIYGNNACSYLKDLKVLDNQNEKILPTTTKDKRYLPLFGYEFQYDGNKEGKNVISINQFKSGGKLYLKFQLIDQEQRILTFSKDKLIKNIYPSQICEELKQLSIIIILVGQDIQLVGQTILNYIVFDEQTFSFLLDELQISAAPSTNKSLTIITNINSKSQDQLKLQLDIGFRKCLSGETIYDESDQIQICYFCSYGSYSLDDPKTLYKNSIKSGKNKNISKTNLCKKCPDSALLCEGSTIELLNGYWRENNKTDEILLCDSTYKSCVAEQYQNQDIICKEGYVGPLCEECDSIGEKSLNSTDRYVSSILESSCEKCSIHFYQYIFMFLQIIIVLLYLIYNSYRFFTNFSYIQSCYYLRRLKFIPLSKPSIQSQSTSFIKIVVNFLQFTSLLISNPTFLPVEINIIPNFLGSSTKNIVLSINCIIPKEVMKQYGKIFIRGALITLLPALFIIFTILILFIMNFLEVKSHQRKYIIYTLMSVVYMFFVTDVISYLSDILTCRKIGSQSYHTADLLTKCNDPHVQKLIIPLAIALLILWLFFPIFNFFRLYKLSDKLEMCIVKFKYGYYYQELNKKFYYWEFVRIYLKIIIIVSYTLMREQNIILARQLAVLFFLSYIRTVTIYQPFKTAKLTKMEILSNQILIIKIILSSFREEFNTISYLFEITIQCLDILFFAHFSKTLILINMSKSNSYFSLFIQKIVKIFFSDKFNLNFKKQFSLPFKSYLRWKLISKNMKFLIINQAETNISLYKERKIIEDLSLTLKSTIFHNLSHSPKQNYDKLFNRDTSLSYKDSPQLTFTNPHKKFSAFQGRKRSTDKTPLNFNFMNTSMQQSIKHDL